MPALRIGVSIDSTVLEAQLSALAKAAERSAELRQLLLDALDGTVEFVRFDSCDLTADAGVLRVRAQLADGLLERAAATGAVQLDALAVEKFVVHGRGASDGC